MKASPGHPGEASEWRDTAAAATPTRSNSDRAFRVAGTVAIVAALAVTTLVFLSGDNDSATTLAGKVVGAVAQNEPAPHAPNVVMAGPKVALSAPPKVALSSSPKASVAAKGTTKMSDNWKINENVPDSPSYADLKREVNELEAEEKHHFEARANSMSKAMDSADKEGNGAALKGLKWKNAKDKYEQAAFKDIMDEEKEHVTETITQQGAQMFQSYEKQAQSLLGTDDLEKLQNSSAIAEKERSMREKSALFALKSASAALKKVESAEDAQREEEDKKKQERADAKEEAHLKNAASLESGSKQYYRKAAEAKVYDAERGEKEKKRIIDYKQDREALKTRDSSGLHQDHEDTPYHQDYLQAKTVEDERKTAFDKEVQMLKDQEQKQREARANLLKQEADSAEPEVDAKKEETKDASAAALKLSDQEEAQHKAALDKGADAEKAAEVKAEVKAVLGKSDTSLSGDYEQTVQKAMTADLKRRAADRKARNAFRTERAKKLAADTAKEGQLFDTMAKVSAAIMQPSQLENVKRVEEGRDTGMAKRLIKDRDSEVNLIMGK